MRIVVVTKAVDSREGHDGLATAVHKEEHIFSKVESLKQLDHKVQIRKSGLGRDLCPGRASGYRRFAG